MLGEAPVKSHFVEKLKLIPKPCGRQLRTFTMSDNLLFWSFVTDTQVLKCLNPPFHSLPLQKTQ